VGGLPHLDEHREAARAEEGDAVEVEHHELDACVGFELVEHGGAQLWGGQHVDLAADRDDDLPGGRVRGRQRDLVIGIAPASDRRGLGLQVVACVGHRWQP
jgi:hypothetical protein